jgi:dUTP pyrophosphatase
MRQVVDIECVVGPKGRIPVQANNDEQNAGYDLIATQTIRIDPFERKIVPTQFSAAIPIGYYGRIAPRSGLAVKHGIDVLAGVIDSSYTGEIGVVLINFNFSIKDIYQMLSEKDNSLISSFLGNLKSYTVNEGDKIAQLIIEPYALANWKRVDKLPETVRKNRGYGDSGV